MSRPARVGWFSIGPRTPGHPVITVARSRSIRSSERSGSVRSTQSSVAPTAMAGTTVMPIPPTQKNGMPQKMRSSPVQPWSAARCTPLRTTAPCVWHTPFGSLVVPDV